MSPAQITVFQAGSGVMPVTLLTAIAPLYTVAVSLFSKTYGYRAGLGLLVLFLFSWRKQTDIITKRIIEAEQKSE